MAIKAKPHAGINHGGDCGPCCLAGITGMTVREVYDICFNGTVDGTSYEDVYEACWKLKIGKHIRYFHNQLPLSMKHLEPRYQPFGNPSWENFNEWLSNAISQLKQGYVGLANVNMDGKAPGDLRHQWMTNHWVLIVGAVDDMSDGDRRMVHISCPTRGEFTIHPMEFLINYGGYNTIWVLPNTK